MPNTLLVLWITIGYSFLSQAQAHDYSQFITRLVSDFETPGVAVGILKNEAFTEYFNGSAKIGATQSIDRHTLFNVASISKLVTSIAVMQLVERGAISLDQPINSYLSRWHVQSEEFDVRKITVRRVLNHTAGLSREFGEGFNARDSLLLLEEILDGRSHKRESLRVVYNPGTSFLYSNLGYGLLQLLIEEVTGKSFNEYVSESIFRPLGMEKSTFQEPLKISNPKKLATPHDHLLLPREQERFVVSAAAGLLSNLHELEILMLEEKTRQNLLNATSYNQLFQGDTKGYGLGHMNYKTDGEISFVGHTGLGMGWNAAYYFTPNDEHGLIVLTNGDNGSYIHETLQCYWYHSFTGKKLTSCNSAINKKLNRISLHLEIATELGSLDPAELNRLVSNIQIMRDQLKEEKMTAFRVQFSQLKQDVNAFLENIKIDLVLLPDHMKNLYSDRGFYFEVDKDYQSIEYWMNKPWHE